MRQSGLFIKLWINNPITLGPLTAALKTIIGGIINFHQKIGGGVIEEMETNCNGSQSNPCAVFKGRVVTTILQKTARQPLSTERAVHLSLGFGGL